MPLLSIAKVFMSLLSLLILAAAAYLLWSWQHGELFADRYGEVLRVRSDWRLWAGLALLAWSFLGGRVMGLVLARRDAGAPSRAERGDTGEMVAGASGSSLYVERHGPHDAPLIVFTHGWGMDSTFWHQARQALSDRFRVVVWDLPGLGRSKLASDKQVALTRFADDLASVLQTCDGRAVLVGHSIGGMTLQTLARDRPEVMDRVAGLVLLNTTYTNPLRTMVFERLLLALQKPLLEPAMRLTIWLQPLVWLSKWQSYLSGSMQAAMRLGFGKYVTRSQLAHASLLATRAPPAVEAKGDLAMFHWDATGALAGLGKPVLVIGGNLDIVTKLEASRTIAAQAGGQIEVVAGVNHMGPMERADLYNAAIAAFTLSVQPAVADRPR